MLQALANKFLDLIAWPWVQKMLSEKVVKQTWEQAILDTSDRTSSVWLPEYAELFQSKVGVCRHLFNTIRPNQPFFTTDDLAISLAFEIYALGGIPDPKVIGRISPIFIQQWLSRLNQNNLCRKHLTEVCGVKTTEILREGIVGCSPDVLSSVSDHYDLLRRYFSTYSRKNGVVTIDVYLPNPQRYIDYLNPTVLPVTVFSEEDLDIGFFRVGVDYSASDGKNLYKAAISPNNLKEIAYFEEISYNSDHVLIWEL